MESRISLNQCLMTILFSVFLAKGIAFANEPAHAEAEPSHGSEAKKDAGAEGGHGAAPAEGGGHGPAVPAAPPAAWAEVEIRISNLDTQMKMKQANMKKLFEEKNHLPSGSPQLKSTITELVSDYKELKRISEELEKQKIILKYRFPERSLKVERTYKKQDLKSLEEMEKQLGIEGQLDRSITVLRKHYSTPEKPLGAEKKTQSQKKTHPSEATPSDEKPIDQQGPIILQK